jgi:hypothetical protein
MVIASLRSCPAAALFGMEHLDAGDPDPAMRI